MLAHMNTSHTPQSDSDFNYAKRGLLNITTHSTTAIDQQQQCLMMNSWETPFHIFSQCSIVVNEIFGFIVIVCTKLK